MSTATMSRLSANLVEPFDVTSENLLTARVRMEFLLPGEQASDIWVTNVSYLPEAPEARDECNAKLIAKAWTKLEGFLADEMGDGTNIFVQMNDPKLVAGDFKAKTEADQMSRKQQNAVIDSSEPNYAMITGWRGSTLSAKDEQDLLDELQQLEKEFDLFVDNAPQEHRVGA